MRFAMQRRDRCSGGRGEHASEDPRENQPAGKGAKTQGRERQAGNR